MRDKALILFFCIFGIVGVGYGMANSDRLVFIAGLAVVVVGYLMIRKKLKAHIKEKYPSPKDNPRRPGGLDANP